MHFLDGEFAKWVNRKRKRSGHLFEGRFHSFLIEKQAYPMEVMRYVALNPVRAKLVARPEEWRWSSYRATAGFEAAPGWLETDWILAQIRSDRAEAQQVYRAFVDEKIGDKTRLWDNVVNQIYLGTEAWIETMRAGVESKPRSDEHPRAQRSVGRPAIQKIVKAVATVFDIDRRDVQEGHGGAPRSILAWLARYEGLAASSSS